MRLVPDDGPRTARIAIIGEAPGALEDQQLRPFVGHAGRLLDRWLAHVGLDRAACYITNVIPWRPEGNKIKTVPRPVVAEWSNRLHQRLAALDRLVVAVPLGNTALRALTGKFGITKHRGSIYAYRDRLDRERKVIGTLHPAAVLRQPGWERQALADWRRIADDSTFTDLRLPVREHLTRPTLDDLRWFAEEAARRADVLAIDIETPRTLTLVPQPPTKAGKERKPKRVKGARRITCVGFAHEPWFSLTVPTTLDYWHDPLTLARVWEIVATLCALPCEKVLQNGLFDTYWLAQRHDIALTNWRWDTRWMHHAMDPTDTHSLACMASVDTRQPFWKDMKDSKEGDDDDTAVDVSLFDTFARYNGLDVCVTRELASTYHQRLVAGGQLAFYDDRYAALYSPLLSLMRTGIQLDNQKRDREATRLTGVLSDLRSRLTRAAGSPLHGPKGGLSPKKLQTYLYTTLKLPKKVVKGKVTAREVAIRQLMLRFPAKLADAGSLILDIQRQRKVSEFLSAEIADPDGYVRPSYSFASTGRLAASSNPMGTGRNTQNFDRTLRYLCIPDGGCLLLCVDLSQAESRDVFARTGDPALIERALSMPWEYDVHTENAALAFGCAESAVTKDQRYLAKRGVHALHYGMQGNKLSEVFLNDGYERTPDECQSMIDTYLGARPAIPLWQRSVRVAITRDRRLTNAWGRSINFEYDRLDDDVFRKGYAYQPQSDIADLLNGWGLVPLWRWLQVGGRRSRINLQMHDELVVSVVPTEAWDVYAFLKASLERPWRCGTVDLTVPVEVQLGTSWQCEREWKKPPGRDEFEAAMEALT